MRSCELRVEGSIPSVTPFRRNMIRVLRTDQLKIGYRIWTDFGQHSYGSVISNIKETDGKIQIFMNNDYYWEYANSDDLHVVELH